jgi:predicted MPP superfamily phosphohydrolase
LGLNREDVLDAFHTNVFENVMRLFEHCRNKILVFAGDQVEFGYQNNRWNIFKQLYLDRLPLDIRMGVALGNHDVNNPNNDCFLNQCACKSMEKHMDMMLKADSIDAMRIDSAYTGSFSTHFNIGNDTILLIVNPYNGEEISVKCPFWQDSYVLNSPSDYIAKMVNNNKSLIIVTHTPDFIDKIKKSIPNGRQVTIVSGHYHNFFKFYKKSNITFIQTNTPFSHGAFVFITTDNGIVESKRVRMLPGVGFETTVFKDNKIYYTKDQYDITTICRGKKACMNIYSELIRNGLLLKIPVINT